MMFSLRRISAAICSIALSTCALANTIPDSFVKEISEKYQLSPSWVAEQMAKAHKQQSVIDRMNTPWEAKPWYQYQSIFLKPERVKKGLEFWQQYEKELSQAEEKYGVPAQFMVAIIGVETYFGRFKGNDPVLDALYTLGFHYPKRGKFFRSELGHFLALAHEQGWQPEAIKGSYAGAMGFGQFISSSYRAYAVDFDGDGKRDLLTNPVDGLGSVANYFARHGWQPGGCLVAEAEIGSSSKEFVQTDTKIKHSWGKMQQAGVKTSLSLKESDKALLFPLQLSESETQHFVGCNNFYVITRYNHSRLYAMAVYQLSEMIRKAREAQS